MEVDTKMKKQKGQVILALILIMTVALAIGLSVVQKSLIDVSTSTKVEESSRAFSAAEAGIEHVLRGGSVDPSQYPTLGANNAKISLITNSYANPCIPGAAGCVQVLGQQQAPLEKPPLTKEEVTQVWLADYNSTTNPPAYAFTNTSLDVYWGDPTATDKAGLEVTIVYYNGTQYKNDKKWYLDNPNAFRNNPSFDTATVSCPPTGIAPPGGIVTYQCKKTLTSLPTNLILLRARLLYNNKSAQPFAVQAPAPPCALGNGCFIPPQSKVLTSTGVSGETQRRIQVTQDPKVVPFYFDFAIFSAGDISK